MRRILVIAVLALALALGVALADNGSVASANPTPGNYVQLPVLGYIGNTRSGVDWVIEAQNVGSTWTKIALLLFSESTGFCQPQAANPFKIECTGLLKPGTSWVWTNGQLPATAKSAIAISYNPFPNQGNDYWRCEQWTTVLNTRTWPEGWPSVVPTPGYFPFGWNPFGGQPIAVEVVRKMPGNTTPTAIMTGAYSGISAMQEGRYDPIFGGFAYYAPVVYSGYNGWSSWIYIQNSGTECTSIELWFKDRDSCLRAKICSVPQVSPGYTAQFNVTNCVDPGFTGSVWIRGSQPLGIVVDQIGSDVLMSYNGVAAELCYVFNGQCLSSGGGSQVAYGPLIYRENNGWQTVIHVQNMSSIVAAKVKVYFVDQSGDIITTLVDWICPRGETEFPLALVGNLPGQYVGAVRVESQAWESPGDPAVNAVPIAAVAELIQFGGGTRPVNAAAYNLFPEDQGYVWQIGAGATNGLEGGVAVIAIPSFMKRGNQYGMVTDIAIQNLVPKPGFTDFVLYVYDQNGLIDYVCEKLNEKQVEYINLDNWNWIQTGFVGSAVISAVYWEHDVLTGIPLLGPDNPQLPVLLRNVVGLAAVKIERAIPGGAPQAGDVTSASEGFPVPPGFDFEGYTPQCPGIPSTCAPIGTLIINVCAPVYVGAPVTVTDDVTLVNYTTTNVDVNGQVFVTGLPVLPTGHHLIVTVGTPDPDNPSQTVVIYTSPVTTLAFPGAPLGPGGTTVNSYTAKIPGIRQTISVPCQSTPGAFVSVTLTPPTGVIEGYVTNGAATFSSAAPPPPLSPPVPFPPVPAPPPGGGADGGVWPSAPLNPMGGATVQLWLPPTAGNQSGTLLRTATTNTEGYFRFDSINPCLLYELKYIRAATGVADGVVATIPGQKYILALDPAPATGLYITYPGPRPIP